MANSELIMGLVLIVSCIITTTAATALAVVLRDDGCTDSFDLLVLVLDLFGICLWIRVNPFLAILECILDLLFFVRIHLFTQTLVLARAPHCRLHGMHVAVKGVLRIDALLHLLVLLCKLLCLFDHLLPLFSPEPS